MLGNNFLFKILFIQLFLESKNTLDENGIHRNVIKTENKILWEMPNVLPQIPHILGQLLGIELLQNA